MGWYEMEHTLKWLFQDLKEDEKLLLSHREKSKKDFEKLMVKYQAAKERRNKR